MASLEETESREQLEKLFELQKKIAFEGRKFEKVFLPTLGHPGNGSSVNVLISLERSLRNRVETMKALSDLLHCTNPSQSTTVPPCTISCTNCTSSTQQPNHIISSDNKESLIQSIRDLDAELTNLEGLNNDKGPSPEQVSTTITDSEDSSGDRKRKRRTQDGTPRPAPFPEQPVLVDNGHQYVGKVRVEEDVLPDPVSVRSTNGQQYGETSSAPMQGFVENTGRWLPEEHDLFLQGLREHGKGQWKPIAAMVKTRSVLQVRTHAQKYFRKLENEEKLLNYFLS